MKQKIARVMSALAGFNAAAARTGLSLMSSAFFWLLVLAVGGAGLIAVGVALLFGLGAGFVAGGVLAVVYGAVVLRGMSDG